MEDNRILTKAKSALKLAHIIRYENGHEIIDVSLLRTIPDDELMKYRNVGKATIEKNTGNKKVPSMGIELKEIVSLHQTPISGSFNC